MSMVTSCPACATTFRITQEQLRVRQGKVRCGQCRGTFDAFKALASMPDTPLAAPPENVEREVSDIPRAPPEQRTLDIGPRSPNDVVIEGRDAFGTSGRLGNVRAARLMTVIVGVLALALAAQLLYAMRDRVSAAVPSLRPVFERVCAFNGCTVTLPKRTEALAIESSDLQIDSARANVIILSAALRNRGDTVLAYPALELTLTNAQDQAIARRVFSAREYLNRAEDAEQGMAALAEVNVRIELDTGDLRASGYRLFLFYP